MPILAKTFLFLGSVGMLLAVALGAFGAHALKKTLAPDLMAVYETAVNYHVYHALGLLAVGLLALHIPESALLRWAGILLAVGVLLFSGSLYTLSPVSYTHLDVYKRQGFLPATPESAYRR